MTPPRAVPGDLTGAGAALWRDLHAHLSFDPHEETLCVELCRTVTLCETLQQQLDATGITVDGQRGPKINPVLAELRQQRLVAARLSASLNIPVDSARRSRGVRGVYRLA